MICVNSVVRCRVFVCVQVIVLGYCLLVVWAYCYCFRVCWVWWFCVLIAGVFGASFWCLRLIGLWVFYGCIDAVD